MLAIELGGNVDGQLTFLLVQMNVREKHIGKLYGTPLLIPYCLTFCSLKRSPLRWVGTRLLRMCIVHIPFGKHTT